MSQNVLKVSSDVIEKMKAHYQNDLQNTIPPGGIFVAKTIHCTVTAYRSGKVLFQGKDAQIEANKWGNQATQDSPNKFQPKAMDNRYAPPANIAELSIIGSDEVGTGDYFGPMTVVASYVDSANIPLLKELGVKDSKNLSDQQIVSIASEIIHVIPYSLLILHNEKYNQLQAKGMSQGKMKAMLHNKAIHHVLGKLKQNKLDGILIDQFARPEVYFNYLKNQAEIVRENVYFSTKGEQVHLAVAASSIIARYAFVKEFEKLSERIGFTLPKGAGKRVDEVAAKLIKKYGIEHLRHYAKVHFANTEKAMNLLK